MDDLISRQAAIKLIEDNSYLIKHNLNDVEKGMTLTGIKQALEFLPSVQPEQKTGRGEHDGGKFANRWICSQCGYKFYFEKSEAKYCPNCGAKMGSEDVNNE